MWPLIKQYLQNNRLATEFNLRMSKFPRWRNLKHIHSPTTIEYSEGQTFVDILKCALPCLVQLLPANSCLVLLVCVMQKIQIILDLDVTTEKRLNYLRAVNSEYQKICEEVDRKHQKSLDFLKQHMLGHAVDIFRAKGTSRNTNTRIGEGFQQEVSALYKRTNGRNAEHQIARKDENEETMARLDMQVEMWRSSQDDDRDLKLIPSANAGVNPPWKLGSADARVSSHRLELEHSGKSQFCNFDKRLREHLAVHHPSHIVRPEERIEIEPCKLVRIDYQSTVNWKSATDILRCNPKFHGQPRYDSLIFSAQDDPLAMGQLELIFRCHLPGRVSLDLAMIRTYCGSSWKPKTRTDCPLREMNTGAMFISLEHVVRGALLCPIFGSPREAVYYVIDCIDGDMFLRLNPID
ncbi:hypothetical protein MVEN_00019800 [Mycena venus]|uniref:Uncharacterized protein n=1 Tax=Mycena venus TaxID=2733690 RepID=A0A8H6Z792_9AGAR|nr:hypothetical protein MVEN_00019800 [Mycena venus]